MIDCSSDGITQHQDLISYHIPEPNDNPQHYHRDLIQEILYLPRSDKYLTCSRDATIKVTNPCTSIPLSICSARLIVLTRITLRSGTVKILAIIEQYDPMEDGLYHHVS